MPRVRALHDPATGKRWESRVDGAKVEIRQGMPGHEKTTIRQLDDADSAHRWVVKEEWARLKKGMILLAPDAAWGEPRLHRFIGGAYTGAMAIAPAGDGGFFCNRFGEADTMLRIGRDATISTGLTLPGERLVWEIAAAPMIGALLLQVDGGVVRWRPETGEVADLVAYRPNPGFVSVAGNRLACYDGTDVLVLDLESGAEILRLPAQAELYAGHSPQMLGALSADGQRLALCSRPGEILLLDVTSGRPLASMRGDFAMVRQMDFLPGGRRLLVTEGYGGWSLRCFDLMTGQPDPGWAQLRIDAGDIAVSPCGRRAAVVGRGAISIHDLEASGAARSFPVEHTVKRCAIAWIDGETLAVRTDYGCASLYATP